MTFPFFLNTIEPKFRSSFLHPTYSFLLLQNWLKLSFELSFCRKFRSFIQKKKIYTSTFYSKNNRKHLAIAVKYVKGGVNGISFIEDVEIKD